MKRIKILFWFTSLALLISACTAPIISSPMSQPGTARPVRSPSNGLKPTSDRKGTVSTVYPSENHYIFEGVRFVPDSAITTGAVGNLIPEKPASADSPYWEIKPEYIQISLEGYPLSKTMLKPVIAVYPVAGYRRLSELAGKRIDSLMDLLVQKPADVRQMPFLPIENAGQVFHSNVRYLDFQNGSGVRYLTVLAQYPAPVNNQDLFYTYQGLTTDGRHYVSIILPVNQASLPASADALPIAELEGITRDPTYYPGISAKLSALPDSSFAPDLAKLDAMVASLAIER